MQSWGSTVGASLVQSWGSKSAECGPEKEPQKCSSGASKRTPKMQFCGFRMAHNKYRIRAPAEPHGAG